MTKRADEKGLFQRGRRWYLKVYVRGQGRQVIALKPHGDTRATTNKDVARALAREARRELNERGRPAAPTPAATDDLSTLIERFQEVNALAGTPEQAADNVAKVRAYIDAAGIAYPWNITTASMQDWFVALASQGRTNKTLWNTRAALSCFFRFLVERKALEENPCKGIRLPKLERLLPRFLSPAEHEQALTLAQQHGVYAEVATALYSGMRRDELRRMAWADIDLDRSVLLVPKAKSRRPRAIPISDKLREVLAKQREQTGGRKHVFPGLERKGSSGMRRGSWWNDALKPLQQALPIFTESMADTATGRGWHLFRHTFASRLVQAGVPIAKVSAWLGHSDIRTTMIYAHLAPGHDKDIEKA